MRKVGMAFVAAVVSLATILVAVPAVAATTPGAPQAGAAEGRAASLPPAPGDHAAPIGVLDSVTLTPGGVRVAGWALDADAGSEPIDVHVYVDGAGAAVMHADQLRGDIEAAYPYGPSHGFVGMVRLRAGDHSVCVYAINELVGGAVAPGGHTLLRCASVTVPAGPFGAIDSVSTVPGGLRVVGWAIDPDAAASIDVQIWVNGAGVGAGAARQSRNDVGTAYPGFGDQHGFSLFVAVPPGEHRVCAYGLNIDAAGSSVPEGNALLACTPHTLPVNPIGVIDSVTRVPGGVRVTGWALDPQVPTSIDVHAWVDGAGAAIGSASRARSDVAAVFPGYGGRHGFSFLVPVPSGAAHDVCVYGIDVAPGSNAALGCRRVVMHPHPIGVLDDVRRAPGGIRMAGWALDPDSADPINVHVYVDGRFWASSTAGEPRADVGVANRGYGGDHGFDLLIGGLPAGSHQVCAYGINVGVGGNALLACRTITVTSDPVGAWVTAVRNGAFVQVTGWALDPDTADPIQVRVTNGLDIPSTGTADQPSSSLGPWARYYGANHGFDVTVAGSGTSETVCVTLVNTLEGADVSLGCRTV